MARWIHTIGAAAAGLVVAGITADRAHGQWHYRYYDEERPLPLDVTKVAIRAEARSDEPHGKAPPLDHPGLAGTPVRPLKVAGWSLADVEPVLGQDVGRIGVATGDFDVDGDVDLDDYKVLADCLNGPDVTAPPPSCDPADFANVDLDADLDVDLKDAAIFLQSFTGPFDVRSGQLCYLAGEMAQIAVDVPRNTGDSLHFLVFEETEDGTGQLLFEQTLPLDGSPTYEFPVVLPNEIMYNAVARLLDAADTEIASTGLELGVRPDLPQIPTEICSFELATVDAFGLLGEVEQAAASGDPYLLEMGSRSFLVNLEENTAGLLSPQVQAENPDVRLFRGTVIGNPTSGVRLSFRGQLPDMFVEASVDPADNEASVYLEPAAEFDPGLPIDLYVGYQSDHVRIPMHEHDADHEEPPAGRDAPGGSTRGLSPCRRLRLNVYDDSGSAGTVTGHLNRIDATFSAEMNLHLFVESLLQINTDAYNDPPDTNQSFIDDTITTNGDADIAMLFTRNSNIDYGTTLGQGRRWSPPQLPDDPYCWVRRKGSNKRIRVVGCQEISHVLGASDVAGAHRNGVYRNHTHSCCWGLITWNHKHYSIMKGSYAGDDASDLKWFNADETTIMNVVTTEAGHFPCPLTSVTQTGQGTVDTDPTNYFIMGCGVGDLTVTLTPIPAAEWRFDGFTGGDDCADWEVTSPSVSACDGCEAQFTALYPGVYSPASVSLHQEPPDQVAPQISWSPDSTRFARTSPNNRLRVIFAANGVVNRTLTGHTQETLAVAWSPNGVRIASGSADQDVRLWSPSSSSSVLTLSGHTDSVTSLAWSPDSAQIASGSLDGSIRIWDRLTGALLHTITTAYDPGIPGFGPMGGVTGLAWSPDSQLLLAITEGERWIFRFDPQTGIPLAGVFTAPCIGSEATTLAWPSAHRLLAYGCDNGPMEICDTRACESTEIAVSGHTGTVHAITWNPDVTQFFSVGQDDYLRRWRASDGQLLDEMQIFFPTGLKSVAWSPNRRYLAIGGDEDSTVAVMELYH